MHADAARLADGDDDDARLLRVGSASLGRRRRGGMGGILGDADVGDVGFLNCSTRQVSFGAAAGN